MAATGDDETYVNEHAGKEYSVYIRNKSFPDGSPGPWLVRFQIDLGNGEKSPYRDVSDEGAKSRNEALALGIKHAEAMIDQQN